MRKLIIFPLITIMTFSLFGCTANVTSSVESTAPSIAGSEEETTTEKSTAEESATQEPTTEEPTTEEPTTEVLFDDGKMSEYVAAAQKVFDTYKEEYESFYGIPLNTYTAFAFCDFDLDTVPELYIMTRDVYSNFNGSVYKYINNEYVFTKNLQGYENIQSYSNSEGNTLLLCTSFSYTSYDHIGNHTFSTDVDCNY